VLNEESQIVLKIDFGLWLTIHFFDFSLHLQGFFFSSIEWMVQLNRMNGLTHERNNSFNWYKRKISF
jgi:hypothetical protein